MMDELETRSAVEAILFAAGEPVPAGRIASVIGVSTDEVFSAAASLADYYSYERRGIRLVRLEGRLQLCSAPEYALYITRVMETRKPPKLSQAALEVLSVVAYFQPVTRAYIDQIRAVDSSYTLGILTERGLVEPCGRLDVPGRPTIYKTSDAFLRTMGITTLEELPNLPDLSSEEGIMQLQEKINELAGADCEQMEITDLEGQATDGVEITAGSESDAN